MEDMAQGEYVDPQEFIDAYRPDTPVAFTNGMRMTLGQALEAERLLCPADETARQDPRRRIGYLANILAAGGSLLPEDEQYLPPAE
jgi:hypothetical protein